MKYILIQILLITYLFSNNTNDFDDEFESEFKNEYKQSTFDPLSGYNKVMTDVNDVLYIKVFTPVFAGYDYVMPDAAQNAIGNFFENLKFPIRFINNLLQFKFKNAGEETLRFVANTIVGFGGISDVATTYYHIPKHNEDFGQTLGYWGIGSGFPVVLPILGQSNLRDIFGLAGDFGADPINYADNAFDTKYLQLELKTARTINENSFDPYMYENLTKGVINLYPFLKNAYEQRRNALIKE